MLAKVFHNIKWDWDTALEISRSLSCEQCGDCCRQPVRLDDIDIKELANFLNCRPRTIRKMLVDGCLPPPCPFLTGNRCRVYDARPIRCRAYPVNPYEVNGQQVVMIKLCKAGQKLAEELECKLIQ